MSARKPYPSDVPDEEWALVAPYLCLLPEGCGQRRRPLRGLFNGLRYVLRNGIPWRAMPNDLPPWAAVHQQVVRWLRAGCFEAAAADLRAVLRVAAGRTPQPTAAVLDSRTLRSTPESGGRAGWDGHKRKRGSKAHPAVDTPGHPLALRVAPASADDRAGVGRLAAAVQDATGEGVDLAFVDQGHVGERPAAAAKGHGIALEAVKPPEAKRGFVPLPRRWVVERCFARAARCRRLARGYERLRTTLAGPHVVAFACLMLRNAAPLLMVHDQPLGPCRLGRGQGDKGPGGRIAASNRLRAGCSRARGRGAVRAAGCAGQGERTGTAVPVPVSADESNACNQRNL